MNRSSFFSFVAIFVVSFSSATLFGQACSKALPHGGDDPIWPLKGRHAFVPCEACHGPGTPHQESTVCLECHNSDRPSPNHYPGQNCAECHTEEGWGVGVGGTGDTAPPPLHTGEPPLHTGGGPTDPIHDNLPADQLCWDCHEVDRKDPLHYADPLQQPHRWWDCAPCHATTTWLDDLFGHPCRTPHGSNQHPTDPTAWVVACADCHTGGDTTVTDCVTCHLAIFDPDHYGVTEAQVDAQGSQCTDACHPTGD